MIQILLYLKIGVSSMLLTVEYCEGVDWTTGTFRKSQQFYIFCFLDLAMKGYELQFIKI